MRYLLHLAYKGTNYNGWQIQPNAPTVQETIQQALGKLLGENITITGVGRTDSGVHASNYYAHFDYNHKLSFNDIRYKLNRMLPNDIVVFKVQQVSNDFHARFSATKRTYTYKINQEKNPFSNGTDFYFPIPLNIDEMNKAAIFLLGTKDFTSFSKLHTDVNNNICTVYEATWTKEDGKLIFTISANRFLRNMVRAIVGTLVDVGKGKLSVENFKHIISDKNRQLAGQSIDACGLTLSKIDYKESI